MRIQVRELGRKISYDKEKGDGKRRAELCLLHHFPAYILRTHVLHHFLLRLKPLEQNRVCNLAYWISPISFSEGRMITTPLENNTLTHTQRWTRLGDCFSYWTGLDRKVWMIRSQIWEQEGERDFPGNYTRSTFWTLTDTSTWSTCSVFCLLFLALLPAYPPSISLSVFIVETSL